MEADGSGVHDTGMGMILAQAVAGWRLKLEAPEDGRGGGGRHLSPYLSLCPGSSRHVP